MRICFDLDKTLCVGQPYDTAVPMVGAAKMLSDLKACGHTIIIQTARGMGSSAGNAGVARAKIGALTFSQLDKWGFVYDEVFFGKPAADLYVDDKSINPLQGFDVVFDTVKLLTCVDDKALCMLNYDQVRGHISELEGREGHRQVLGKLDQLLST